MPCAPVYTVDQVLGDPQVQHLEVEQAMEHPTEGTVRTLGFPVRFSQTGLPPSAPPPTLGEHSERILAELGYSPTEIQQLRADGAV